MKKQTREPGEGYNTASVTESGREAVHLRTIHRACHLIEALYGCHSIHHVSPKQ